MDGQPAGIQTGVGKGRILEKEEEEKSKMSKVTDDQPSGSQTEAGKGRNTKETAKDQIFAPQTVRSKGAGGCTTSHNHSAISPAVKQSAIFTKLAAMHGNIGDQNEIDRKARTSLEMAMAQGAGQKGSSSGGQPTGSQTVAGKGRTNLAAQPVGPMAREGKGGNQDRESKDTPDVDGFMERRRHDPASQGRGAHRRRRDETIGAHREADRPAHPKNLRVRTATRGPRHRTTERRKRGTRGRLVVRPAHGARGPKGDRSYVVMPFIRYAAQETDFERARPALAPRLKWYAGQEVVARAGIQPNQTRRTPLMCRTSKCSVVARRTPTPTPGITCQAPLPMPTLRVRSKSR
ncbi:hypothetical protein RND71_023367 [Anisodus tanguticus]|uniref:Uncharacterized protein n=1 Tax=Anisodus tanguticus TaxID=243964 RepID=A0AAE1V6W8_9SOLA|nr:hypothetical protein RND71_023367 [Anisodus tanguticus]